MKLVLKRSQKAGGLLGGTVVFLLDARVDLTPEETANLKKYKMGSTIIYNSKEAEKHLDKLRSGEGGIMSMIATRMALNISIDGLVSGQHIEAKSLDELLGAENAVNGACKMLKEYLETAKTFDGREIVIEF